MKLHKLNNWGYSLDTGVPVSIVPRSWQVPAYDAVLKHISAPNPKPSLVRAIMGSGKSILLAQIIASVELEPNECIVVTTPTQKLVRQLFATIRDRVEGDEFLLTPKVGMYYALKKDFNTPIIVTCLPSAPELAEILTNRLSKKCALMFLDEAHRSENTSIKSAHGCLAPLITCGASATPFLAKEDSSLTLFETLLYDYGPKEAIADKVVVPWRIINWQGGEAELDEACFAMCKDAVGPGMFNAVSIKDAEEFADNLNKNGFPAMAVHSKLLDSEVDARIFLLKTGKLRAIVHVNMLAEGVDLPWLQWLCLRRPVSSRVRFAQEVGRVLRAWFDKLTGQQKTEAVLYDPHDLFGSLKLTYEAVLGGEYLNDKEKPEEDPIKEMQRALEQQMFICTQELVGAKADKRPLNMGPLASYLRELVNAFDVCGLCDRKVTPGSWRSMGISAKQDVAIGNLGWTINHRSVPKTHQRCLDILSKERRSLSKGLASDLMTVMMTIGDKKKWPDFKSLDTSASENLKKRDEAATRVPEFNKGVPLKPQSQQQLTAKQKQDKIQGKLFK
jgi:superfamily II DNA or RNA helicase